NRTIFSRYQRLQKYSEYFYLLVSENVPVTFILHSEVRNVGFKQKHTLLAHAGGLCIYSPRFLTEWRLRLFPHPISHSSKLR
ncbi:MAG: hypothetical protein WBA07_33200, partial [Rivularia sp. (in: cyanobacteria)]